jgi:hypothetical protein
MIPPTLSGVQEVARRWCAGEAVVIPTECTYEVGIRLSAMAISGEPVASPSPSPLLEAAGPSSPSSSPSNFQLRVQDLLRSHEKHSARSAAASETETSVSPHIYVSGLHKSSAATAFLKRNLPERKYAYRREGKVVSLHVFSESIQVLKRLSAKLWPGPVMLYVAVGGRAATGSGMGSSSSSSTLSSSASCCSPSRASSVTTTASAGGGSPSLTPAEATTHESLPSPPPSPPATPVLIAGHASASPSPSPPPPTSVPEFLALRCPCHPLAVRVSHEFYQNSSDLLVGCALLHRHMNSRCDADSDDEDDVDEDRAVADNNGSSRRRIGNGGAGEEEEGGADRIRNSDDAYVIRAGDVLTSSRRAGAAPPACVHTAMGKVGAVLHGEQTLELFHVPPCEYRQPYGVSVWIDEGSRRIVIRGSHHADALAKTKTAATNVIVDPTTPTTAANANANVAGFRPQVSVSSVRQALLFKPKNERDQVVHAVLNKWSVDEEP